MIVNAVLFNVAWFGCIYWGNAFVPVVLVWAFFHVKQNTQWKNEIRFLLVVVFIGTLIDSALAQMGFFVFEQQSLVIPIWLIAIWLSFALTLNSSLSFLERSIKLQCLLGAIAPPFSYLAGHKLGAVDFDFPLIITMLTISFIWAHLLPLCFALKRYCGMESNSYA